MLFLRFKEESIMMNKENRIVEINADMFIIPNGATQLSSCWWYGKDRDYARSNLAFYKNLCLDNGKDFNQDENLVQIWITNDVSENIIRHGYRFIIDGEKYHLDNCDLTLLEDCPKSLIDIKEGEVADIMLKNFPAYSKDGTEISVDIQFHLTAKQLSYRYGSGTFENILQKVCNY
jgi:hypothetical protein